MSRRWIRIVALVATGGLAMVSCGGSDDDSSDAEPAASEVSTESDSGSDAAGSGDDGTDDAADDAGDDVGGSGSNDDAQQSLDDVGVDMDLDELEDTVGNFSTGEGGGVVTIDGADVTFEATGVCISQGEDFVAEGLGQTSDGEPAWVGISASVDDLDGDGEPDHTVDVTVEVGKIELFGSGPDDAPNYSASYIEAYASPDTVIEYELADGRISGSGRIQDFNGVAIPFGESAEMTFEASCT
jgi:hypothetical protein